MSTTYAWQPHNCQVHWLLSTLVCMIVGIYCHNVHTYVHTSWYSKARWLFLCLRRSTQYCCDYIQNVIITIANLANIVMIAITITNWRFFLKLSSLQLHYFLSYWHWLLSHAYTWLNQVLVNLKKKTWFSKLLGNSWHLSSHNFYSKTLWTVAKVTGTDWNL